MKIAANSNGNEFEKLPVHPESRTQIQGRENMDFFSQLKIHRLRTTELVAVVALKT